MHIELVNRVFVQLGCNAEILWMQILVTEDSYATGWQPIPSSHLLLAIMNLKHIQRSDPESGNELTGFLLLSKAFAGSDKLQVTNWSQITRYMLKLHKDGVKCQVQIVEYLFLFIFRHQYLHSLVPGP